MKILIIEDEKILLEVLKEELGNVGFKIITANNGQEALDKLKDDPSINLVLLDILTPVMDGFEFLKRIHEDENKKLGVIPVIVLSNLGQDEEIKKALKLGAVDYFVKANHPISEIVEKIKDFLK
jgi:CheY-like chemotaxis protein